MTASPAAASRPAPSSLARIVSRAVDALHLALSRFPFASLAISILALLANLRIAEIQIVSTENEVRIAAALAVAAAVSVAAALFAERRSGRMAVAALAASTAGAVAGLAVWFCWNGVLFVPPFLAAAILAVPLAPHLLRSNGLRFWTFALWTGFGVSLGFVSVLLFVVGVSAILEMVRYLFGIGLGGRSYQHIYATAVVLVGPLFALGRIPREFDEEATVGGSDRFTAGLAMLQNWVATPLVLAAAVILHLYAAKILLTGEVPKNQIGWIVSVYAVFVLSLRLAAAPFIAAGTSAGLRVFGLVWMPILVVPLLLLSYAVWLRVGAEGFTPERYYLALAALAAALIVLVQAAPTLRGDARVMFAVPVALLALSSFGAWGVASTVGRSQTALIARDFAVGSDGRLHPEAFDEARRDVLRSRVSALAEVGALQRLRPLMSAEAVARADADNPDGFAQQAYFVALGIEYGSATPEYLSFAANGPRPFAVSDFDTVQTGFTGNEGATPIERLTPDITAQIRDGRIEFRLEGTVDRLDPAEVVARVWPDGGDVAATDPAPLDLTTLDGRHVRLRVTYLARSASAASPSVVSFDLAFRAAEWPASASLGGDGKR